MAAEETRPRESDPWLGGLARTYLATGECVVWEPDVPGGTRIAVDAELASTPVPPALAARFGVTDPDRFWVLWTRCETAAKLYDVPILTWVRRHGLRDPVPRPGLALCTITEDGVTVTRGTLDPSV